jgi:dihydroorotate dehydrogenase (fumarate)
MKLKHPIIASSSPLSGSVAGVKRLEDAGASAVVLFSLFEEQLKHESAALEHFMTAGTESFAESLSYLPEIDDYTVGPDTYLDLLRRASEAVDIPVIGSLNGITNSGWIEYAQLMQQAGAKGIELNIYYIPADLTTSGRAVEERYIEIVKAVKASVTIPVAVKLSPFFSAIGSMSKALDDAGADALVLFNRFYQPDFDLEKLDVAPNLPLLWIAVLYGKLRASLGATRGVHTPIEVVKYLMAGADAVMTTSALLKNGVDYLSTLRTGLQTWMEMNQYHSVAQMKGSMSQQNVADPTAFERANYIKTLESYKGDYI